MLAVILAGHENSTLTNNELAGLANKLETRASLHLYERVMRKITVSENSKSLKIYDRGERKMINGTYSIILPKENEIQPVIGLLLGLQSGNSERQFCFKEKKLQIKPQEREISAIHEYLTSMSLLLKCRQG